MDDRGCPADESEPTATPGWLRGLLASAAALTGALVPVFDDPRDRWRCPFCSWETA